MDHPSKRPQSTEIHASLSRPGRLLSRRTLIIVALALTLVASQMLSQIALANNPSAATQCSLALAALFALLGGWLIGRPSSPAAAPTRTRISERLALATANQPFARQMHEFFRASAHAVVIGDADGKIVWVNDAFVLISGHAREEILGQALATVFSGPGTDDATVRGLQEHIKTGNNFCADIVLSAKTKPYRWSNLEIQAIRDGEGRLTNFIAISRDISRRKQTEEELQKARALADAASRSKSDFLASMSHEIRTPLMTILGYAELLLDPKSGPEGQKDSVKTILRSGEHLLSLINNILDISKIEAGRMPIEHLPCSPIDIANEVVALMSHWAGQKGLELRLKVNEPVQKTILSDPTRLRQILVNLVGNALKFTKTGFVEIEMGALAQTGGSRRLLQYSVRDTGPGIAPEYLAMLFEPFMQAGESGARAACGTGLGLHISRRLAELLGGEIAVDTQPGKGTTFSVTIDPGPISDLDIAAQPIPVAQPETIAVPTAETKLCGRILLVEDSLDNQRLLSFILERAGATVDVTDNGIDACARVLAASIADASFDLVLMDMQMPGLNGHEATARLRGYGYRGSIIAFTANTLDGDRERCLVSGCDGYVSKPIDRRRLLSTLEPYLNAAREKNMATETLRNPQEALISELSGDPDFGPLVKTFVARLPQHLDAMEKAMAGNDLAQVREIAHQLKGVATGYGFPAISDSAGRLENFIKTGADLSRIGGHVGELASLCRRAKA